MPKVGDKNQVWIGAAAHTSGGLTRADLMLNKRGKVVSKAKHAQGLRMAGNLIPRGRGGAQTYFGDPALGGSTLGDVIQFGHLLGLGPAKKRRVARARRA